MWTMYMHSGQQLKPTAPTESDININDIAHGLAMICRYNGQSKYFFSVAEHSVLMSQVVPDKLKRVALMHDAAEYILGDVASPVKQFLNDFEQLEDRILSIIFRKYGVPMTHFEELKPYDKGICIDEMAILMPEVDPALILAGYKKLDIRIELWSPEKAKGKFIERFNQLFPAHGVTQP